MLSASASPLSARVRSAHSPSSPATNPAVTPPSPQFPRTVASPKLPHNPRLPLLPPRIAVFAVSLTLRDLDSATCAIVAAYFSSLLTQHVPTYIPLLAIPRADVPLRPELTYLLSQTGIDRADLCTLDDVRSIDPSRTSVFLVDHNVPRGGLADIWGDDVRRMKVEGIIDHHEDEGVFITQREGMKRYDVQKSGSCASLVTNWISSRPSSHLVSNDPVVQFDISGLLRENVGEMRGVAQLLLSAILIDTANLKSKATSHDYRAAQYLTQYIPELNLLNLYDTLRDVKNSIDGMSLAEILRRDYKEFSTPLGKLGVSTVNRPIPVLKNRFSSFEEDVKDFIVERGLCTHILMTWNFHDGEFQRAGMIVSRFEDVVTSFKEKGRDKFGMHGVESEIGSVVDGWTEWVYEQDDLDASRKQVAPFVQEVMKSVRGTR